MKLISNLLYILILIPCFSFSKSSVLENTPEKIIILNNKDTIEIMKTMYIDQVLYDYKTIYSLKDYLYIEYNDYYRKNKSVILINNNSEKDTLKHIRTVDNYNPIKYSKYVNEYCWQYNYNFKEDDEIIFKCEDKTYYTYNSFNKFRNEYYLFIRNFRNCLVLRYDSNYNLLDTVFDLNSFVILKEFTEYGFIFKASTNKILKYFEYNYKTGIKEIYENNNFMELDYIQNNKYDILAYDSMSVSKLLINNKSNNTKHWITHENSTIYNLKYDSLIQYSIKNKTQDLTFYLNRSFRNEKIDTNYIVDDIQDTLVKVFKNDSTYIMYRLLIPNKITKPKKMLFITYGGYYFQSLSSRLREVHKKLLKEGYAIVFCSVSGDGDIDWEVCQNGYGLNSINTIDDIHTIVKHVSKTYKDAKRYAWTGSYGSYLLLCNSFKYIDDFEKVVLSVGSYDYLHSINKNPHLMELLGYPSTEMINFHNSINPIISQKVNLNTKFYIINNEYDPLVNNSSVLKLLNYFNENSIKYEFVYREGLNHKSNSLKQEIKSLDEIEMEIYEE